jgi:cytochrome d ubiquinol oxidase subunit I
MKRRHTKMALESLKIGAAVGLVAALLTAVTGHKSAQDVAAVQPMKLAAMEALQDGGNGVGLKLVEGIEVPYALSFMATNDFNGYVPGINDLLNGYKRPDGTVELSVDEKIERGRKAIEALAEYRQGKVEGVSETALIVPRDTLSAYMKYFGYGYIKDKAQVVPPIAVNFWAFRIMVGVGCLLIAYFALLLVLTFKVPFLFDFTRRLLAALRILPKTAAGGNDVTNLPAWHYWLAIILIPLAYIGSESGWLVAEFGRQPWTIQDMLPTWVAVSDLHASSVMLTFFIFLVLFTTMLAVEIRILLKQIKKGPDCE